MMKSKCIRSLAILKDLVSSLKKRSTNSRVVIIRGFPKGALLVIGLSIFSILIPQTILAHAGHDGGEETNSAADAAMNSDRPKRMSTGQVYLPKPTQRLLEIRTELTKKQTVALSVQLTGHVKADPNYQGQVQAAITGRISPSGMQLPYAGQWVKKGQLLTQLVPIAGRFDQGNQQAQLEELNSSLDLAEKRLRRLKKLEGSVPKKTLIEVRNEVKSLRKRRSVVAKSLGGLETLRAPVEGFITRADVKPGQIVEEREILFEIINPKRLRVEALSYIRNRTIEIEKAFVKIDDDNVVELIPLGRSAMLKGHAVPYLFEVSRENPPLVVEQAVEVVVTTKESITGIVLPRNVLVKDRKGKDIVWVHDKAEIFLPRDISWQPIDGANIVITQGVQNKERIVTNGAALLTQVR